MTTYNGEKYLHDQIDSILNQTICDFELIICDDCSSDSTWSILTEYAKKDNRIYCYRNDRNIGYAVNFINVIMKTRGEYIFLCDQDDIWHNKKIEYMSSVLHQNKKINLLISHDIIINSHSSFPLRRFKKYKVNNFGNPRQLTFNNIVKTCSYKGANMCFTKQLKNDIIDIYNNNENIIAHDWLISLYAAVENSVYYIDQKLLFYRLHGNNTSRKGINKTNKKIFRQYVLEKKIDHYMWALTLKKTFTDSQTNLISIYIQWCDIRIELLKSTNILKVTVSFIKCFLFSIKNSLSIKSILKDIAFLVYDK